MSIVSNAIIENATITFERGFILTAYVFLDYGGTGQGFGGFVLGGNPFDSSAACARHGEQRNLCADFIGGVMAAVEVDNWADLKGKVVRVERTDDWGKAIAIGHPIKDRWYRPDQALAALVATK